MSKYGEKWPRIAKWWDAAEIKPAKRSAYNAKADLILRNKQRYMDVQAKTNVPWWLIAALHMRESDNNFRTYLGNGDPLNRKTRNVPAGRGPFPTWEAGALDALKYDALTGVTDWRVEKALWYAERFNGFGYEKKGIRSPYIWSGTTMQQPGKYVSDGVWSSTAMDQQLGVAGILKTLAEKDSTIHFVRET